MKYSIRKGLGVFSIGLFLALNNVTPAAASCYCGPSIQNAANQITAAINSTSSAEMQHATQLTYSQTSEIVGGLKQIGEILKTSQTQLSADLDNLERRLTKHSTERTYEPGAMPETNCGNDEMSGSVQNSIGHTRQAASDIMKKLYERKTKFPKPVDYRNELVKEDRPSSEEVVELMGILEPGKTLTAEETAKNFKILEAITNPIPLADLPDEGKQTSAGKNYLYKKDSFESRQAIYQAVITRYLSERAPTMDNISDWAIGKWGDMGGSGNPPGLVDGRMSQDAWRNFMAKMRIGSANWHEQILPTLPEAGLLRDIAAMQAFQLELEMKQVELLEQISLMMALDGAQKLESTERIVMTNHFDQAVSVEQK